MEITTFKRWDLKFFVVTLLCFFGAASSSLELWKELHGSGGSGLGPPMATVEKREAKVRRRPKSSYIWAPVEANENLYQKDSVQTAEASAAAIRLTDGSLLEMGENSLVVIDQVGDLSLNFLRGQMVLRKATGDKRVSVGADGKAKIEDLPIRLLKPEPLARIFAPEGAASDVEFSWQALAAEAGAMPEKFLVQISQDRRFPAGATRVVAGESHAQSAAAKLVTGHYYWRVLDAKGERPLGEPGQFRIAPAAALRATWPGAGAKLVLFGEGGATQFRWVPPPKDSVAVSEYRDVGHRIQVASDVAFKSVVSEREIAPGNGMADLAGLAAGEYFWRIESRYGSLRVASSTQKFEIDRKNVLAIELGSPDENGVLPVHPGMRFTWNADSQEVEFVWEVARAGGGDPKGREIVATTRGRGTAAEWKSPSAGRYAWRVTAFLGTQKAAETPWRALSLYPGKPLALKTPEKDKEIRYWDKAPDIEFSWEAESDEKLLQAGKVTYQIQVARDAQFTQVAGDEKTSSTTIDRSDLKLEPGTYFWKVTELDGEGRPLKTSEPSRFSFGLYPPPRAPAMALPAPGAVIDLLSSDKEPALNWKAVEGAEKYEVVVSEAGRSKPLVELVTSDPEIPLKDLKPGKYSWTIRSLDKMGRKGEPMVRQFTVSAGNPLPPPESLSPEVQ